jgi:hypothetical protein
MSRLQLIYFLVEGVLRRRHGKSLSEIQPDYRDFARTYLYPSKKRLGESVQRVTDVLAEDYFGTFPDPTRPI